MMALDSAVVILMAEALAVLILLAVALFFVYRSKRNKEMNAINSFITELEEQAFLKNKPLEQLLADTCGMKHETVEATLQEVTQAERALFQQIIQLFLQRETALLADIDQRIGDLSEPYCRLLSDIASGEKSIVGSVTGEGSDDKKAVGLERVNQQLVRQLDTAMKTIDEITAEYTRVFSGNQTELELENSSKKMLQIFQEAEHSIREQLHQSGS